MKSFQGSLGKKGMHHFLVPVYAGLGNAILKTPFFRELKSMYPNSKIDVLADSEYGVALLLSKSDLIDEIISLPRSSGLFSTVKFFLKNAGKYDASIIGFDSQNWKIYLGTLIARIPIRIGHIQKHRSLKLAILGLIQSLSINSKIPVKDERHEIDLYLDLLEIENRPESIYKTKAPNILSLSDNAKKILSHNKFKLENYYIVQLSAANGGQTPKIWPKSNFQMLLSKMINQDMRIIIVGDKNEREYSEEVLDGITKNIINLTGLVSLLDTIFLIKNAECIICHDSGLMHIADAYNRPLIALFGPGNLVKNYPKSKLSQVASISMACSPCMGRFYSGFKSEAEALEKCPYDIACMKNLAPEMIWNMIESTIRIDSLE